MFGSFFFVLTLLVIDCDVFGMLVKSLEGLCRIRRACVMFGRLFCIDPPRDRLRGNWDACEVGGGLV